MCNEEIWSEICKNRLDALREERGVRKKRSKYISRKGSFEGNFERNGGDFYVDLSGLKSSTVKFQVFERWQGHN